MSVRQAILTILCCLAWLSGAGAGEVQPSKRPHIVFVLVDDMGYGDASCYNSQSKIETPQINQLARDGMRFTDAHASGPLCHLSRYGLLTGRYPFRAQVNKWRQRAVIEPDQVTVASHLRDAGYATVMIGKWHLGFDERAYDEPWPGGPADRGFAKFFGIRASTDIPDYFYIRDRYPVEAPTKTIAANASPGWSPIQGAFWRAGKIAPDMQLEDVLPKFTDEAVAAIGQHARDNQQQPLFLYWALPAPHTPWLPAETFAGKSKAGMYGDFVEMVDEMLGRVLTALRSHGMEQDTLLIFSSDNGPVWYEQDVKRFGHDSSGGLRGMKGDAWENGHRMPFLVLWPGVVQPGSTSDQLTSFVDLLATVADITQTPLPDNAAPDSFSFYPALLGKSDPSSRQQLALRSANGMQVMREGPWKLIRGLGSGGFSKPGRRQPQPGEPAGQLYHLQQDRGEKNNLYSQQPELVSRLEAAWDSIDESQGSRPGFQQK